jgi:hypothetical protein
MRRTIAALIFGAASSLVFCQSASAFAISAGNMNAALSAASRLQRAQYYERHTRHYVIKCYRELVIGRYVCHRFYYW